MMLRPQTREYIEKLSDQELFEYVCQEDYEPEAIAFARSEFDRRKLDPQQVAAFAAVANARADDEKRTAGEAMTRPLSTTGKTFAFIAGIFPGIGVLCALIATIQFHQRGETQKMSALWRVLLYGFGALVIFLAILFLLPVVLRH
jgi:hypothetical protein